MRFSLALPMLPPDRLVPLAQAAEAAGWDAVTLPESVFYPEEVSADYPYSADGKRFWAADSPMVDPFDGPTVQAATGRTKSSRVPAAGWASGVMTCLTTIARPLSVGVAQADRSAAKWS